jgi:hypothetical protein
MDILVFTYACGEGVGGVLMQDNHLVCYESKKLKDQENNYVTHDVELVAIIHALKMWHQYLMGRNFVSIIDHNGLKNNVLISLT